MPQAKNTKKKSVLDTYKDENDAVPQVSKVSIPSYPNRQNFIPRNDEDFGDGGAYPEIHLIQYPLGLGRKDSKRDESIQLRVDKHGNVNYDHIIRKGDNSKIMFTKFTDMIEKTETESLEIDEQEIRENTERTRKALEETMSAKAIKSIPGHVKEDSYMKFTSQDTTKIVKIVEMPVDPLEPPKFRNQKAPPRPPSPPVPILRSPPKKLTKEDYANWKIPPCISNWVNPNGFTIPLDKRLASDGRGLQEVQVSNAFGKFRESLHAAEDVAREDLEKRKQLQKLAALKEKEEREEKLKNLASMMRQQREEHAASSSEEEGERERGRIMDERRREISKEKKSKKKIHRDEDRDISEKIALGMPSKIHEDQIDARLYNFDSGLSSGDFKTYDRPMNLGGGASSIYQPRSEGKSFDLDKIMNNDKFTKPTREFTGAQGPSTTAKRDGPVEFEREDDPFGMAKFMSEAKEGKKRPLDHIGKSGHLGISGGQQDYDSLKHSKRTKVEFDEK